MSNKPVFFDYSFVTGDPNGIAKCACKRASIVSYKVPRDRIKQIKELEGSCKDDFANPGIYFLLGKPVDRKIPIYVGQAAPRKDGTPFYFRLSEHNTHEKRTKDWWTTALLFMDATRNSQRINETGLKYLENLLYTTMKDNPAIDLRNGNEPPGGSPDESMISVLDDVFEGIRLCAKVLGFSGEVEIAQDADIGGKTLNGHTSWGDAFLLWDGKKKYTLLAGSAIRTSEAAPSLSKGSLQLRQQHADKYLPDGKLKCNIEFSSSSAAADFVVGSPTSGPKFWKDDDGHTLDEIRKQQNV